MEKHASAFCQTKSEQCLNFEQRISNAKWPILKTSLKKNSDLHHQWNATPGN